LSSDIAKIDPKMLEILRAIQNGSPLPKPFSKDALVLKTYIAGTHYSDAKNIVDSIKEGNYLVFHAFI